MRIWMLVLVFLSALNLTSARADDVGGEIRTVISNQIAAFRADDLETAFSFASPMIRRMFGDPDRFGEMVQRGYPMVWRPADVRFSALGDVGGHKVQSVLMTDQSGTLFIVDYDMVPGENGWQINGVRVREASDANA